MYKLLRGNFNSLLVWNDMAPTNLWKKNLYENNGFPDNYTDESFLKDLRKNVQIQEITLLKCIKGSTVIVQEFCTVVFFIIAFVYLDNELIEPGAVFLWTALLTLLGFIYYRSFHGYELKTTVRQDVRMLLIFLVFGQIFSPVLHTLTDTVSTDTIYTMASLMMLIHLIFFDYGFPAAIVSNSLSLSAAMIASISLSSRLSSPFHAFVLLTLAAVCFVLFPLFRMCFSDLLSTCILACVTVYLLSTVSLTMTVLFSVTLIFINFICPYYFLRWQKYKENIYGPWDEAIVQDIDNVNELL